MTDKFRVDIPGLWKEPWPTYFDNFWMTCRDEAAEHNWETITVANYKLKPHGKLIQTSTQGWYLRWDDEKYHTHFVMRWS